MTVSNEQLLNWAKAQLENNGEEYENGRKYVTLFECEALRIIFGRSGYGGSYHAEVDNRIDVALHSQDFGISFYNALRIAYVCRLDKQF